MLTDLLGKAFLAPVYFAFLGLIPVVVLLYLLKLRRTHVIISSTLLWYKSLQDLTANAPFQRLRRNLLLFLQLLVVLFLVFGLARPFVKAKEVGRNNFCLVIDRSASMQAVEGGQSRLELAQEKALGMIDEMAGGDKMMIVTFGKSSDVLRELTDDRYALRAAVRSISACDTTTRIRDALLVANSLQASTPDLRTVVMSDGKISDLEEVGARAFDVGFLQIGETGDNAGIIAFSVRDPQEADGAAAGKRECLVLVRNENTEPLECTLSLFLDDSPLTVEEVKVPATDVGEVVFAFPNLDTGVLRAHLDHEDALAVDNTAWLTLRPAGTIKVLLVAEGEATGAYFLKRVLGLNPRVALSTVAPASYTGRSDFDVVVFNDFAPPELPAAGVLVFFNALPPVTNLSAQGELANPPIVATDPDHPVMRFLNPSNVTIAKAQKLSLPDGARPLISTQGSALVADVSRGGQQILVVAFDLADSTWPLRLSFPLFMQNVMAWAPKGALASETSVAAGDPLVILPAPDVETATVTVPDGSTAVVKLDPTRPVYFAETTRTGLYSVQWGDKQELYAVDLLDSNESAITPAASLRIGRSEVAAQRDRAPQNRELWRWLVLAAVGVLSLEWWIYSRRAWL